MIIARTEDGSTKIKGCGVDRCAERTMERTKGMKGWKGKRAREAHRSAKSSNSIDTFGAVLLAVQSAVSGRRTR